MLVGSHTSLALLLSSPPLTAMVKASVAAAGFVAWQPPCSPPSPSEDAYCVGGAAVRCFRLRLADSSPTTTAATTSNPTPMPTPTPTPILTAEAVPWLCAVLSPGPSSV
eukprot:CAMPEP_0202873656 /NCGR_PEP_ID=MMETSP1391-20130828/23686_1 /ASSEMBLY_ACC=CAM_ASM_000867 /TAXON_ID=1034604 /ORGANISM="Chlamydomonas leiostraca, Strain SAG 11-49" /LENGTH=108 /DNA_ID=CAMNT_0049554911 /DNA_START=65 /DNA_END=388 /DNA_ORIENTATION=+